MLIRLAPDAEDEYRRLHRAVWPTVQSRLVASGVRNYTIFVHGDLLFSYMEYVGDDLERDMVFLADDPETQRWWQLTAPLQRTLSTNDDEWWVRMDEVFHLDGNSDAPQSVEGACDDD